MAVWKLLFIMNGCKSLSDHVCLNNFSLPLSAHFLVSIPTTTYTTLLVNPFSGRCITQDSPYMGFLTSDAKIHSHKAWRLTALREPLSAASFRTRVQGQLQGLLSKHRRLLGSDPCWEGKSNKVFLSCLLAYILLWYCRWLVSKRVLWRHKERFSRSRYSTLWEKNTSCVYPQFFPGSGWHGSWLAKGWSVQNVNTDTRCKHG